METGSHLLHLGCGDVHYFCPHHIPHALPLEAKQMGAYQNPEGELS